MKIIISPAKKMNVCEEWISPPQLPIFLKKAERLKNYIRSLSRSEVSEMWKCNEKLTELNYQRFQQMDLYRNLTPALLAYEGIQYQYMAPSVFEDSQWDYVKRHLRILSGFYGILRPDDGVVPYRLEMQAKGNFPLDSRRKDTVQTLYEFWGDDLYRALADSGEIKILNLASKEYAKAVEPFRKTGDIFITCVFGTLKERGGKLKVVAKGTEAKMARGEMVRFLAANQIEEFEQIKEFTELGYRYRKELSGPEQFVFCKE